MKVIGITGGVGSGKSTVAGWIEEEWPVRLLLADEIGHLAFSQGSGSYQKIVDYFGMGVLASDGSVRHDLLAAEIFGSDEKRAVLNSIVHPFVMDYLKREIAVCRKQEQTVLLESAILIESGCLPLCDEVWYVSVPEKLRRKRLKESRHYTDEKIDAIMKKQLSEEEFLQAADFVLYNEGSKEDVIWQIRNRFVGH